MKIYPSDIVVKIHLHDNESIKSKMLIQSLDTLETSLYASDRMDILLAHKEVNFPKLIRDACLERLRHYKHERLSLHAVKPGSIVLWGLVSFISYVVLNHALGDPLNKGYQETEIHGLLKDFFKQYINRKLLFLSENIKETFINKKQDVDVTSKRSDGEEPNYIIVDRYGKPFPKKTDKNKIGSIGKELDK